MWISDRSANTRMGANSVAKTYKVLRAVMESALDAELILRNPCRNKGAGTERLPEMRCATSEQVAALAEAVEPEWRALILLAACSGLRWGELQGYVDATSITCTRPSASSSNAHKSRATSYGDHQ